MLLLDTHAWIWCVDGSNRLGRQAQCIARAAEADGELYVSPVSVFEVAALHTENQRGLPALHRLGEHFHGAQPLVLR